MLETTSKIHQDTEGMIGNYKLNFYETTSLTRKVRQLLHGTHSFRVDVSEKCLVKLMIMMWKLSWGRMWCPSPALNRVQILLSLLKPNCFNSCSFCRNPSNGQSQSETKFVKWLKPQNGAGHFHYSASQRKLGFETRERPIITKLSLHNMWY